MHEDTKLFVSIPPIRPLYSVSLWLISHLAFGLRNLTFVPGTQHSALDTRYPVPCTPCLCGSFLIWHLSLGI